MGKSSVSTGELALERAGTAPSGKPSHAIPEFDPQNLCFIYLFKARCGGPHLQSHDGELEIGGSLSITGQTHTQTHETWRGFRW